MNESCTVNEMTPAPDLAVFVAGTQTSNPPGTQQTGEASGGRPSSSDIAQKVLRLTGNVRLASRSAHHWHHCGINE